MKRILFKLFMTAVFLLFFAFALKNTDSVALRYFLGFEWQAPLVFMLLVFFGLGIASGAMASLAIIVRQRREILALKRDLRRHTRAVAAPLTATAESL